MSVGERHKRGLNIDLYACTKYSLSRSADRHAGKYQTQSQEHLSPPAGKQHLSLSAHP